MAFMTGSKRKLLHSISPWRIAVWLLFGALLLAGVILLLVRPAWLESIPVPTQVLFWLVSIGELIGLLYLVRLVIRYQDRLAVVDEQRQETETRVAQAYQRLEAIFRVSQKFLEASDEREVIELVLRLSVDLVGAKGASYVPLDDHGQPLAMISHGELPAPEMDSLLEYLASPEVRRQCLGCKETERITHTCPLLDSPALNASGIFCLPLGRDEHEFGMLNLYLPGEESISQDTHAFLGAMIDQTALALEGVRLRRRELAALRQMQSVRQKTGLDAQLSGLLESVSQTLDSDFAMLVISRPGAMVANTSMVQGGLPSPSIPFVEGVAQGVIASGQPVLLGNVASDTATSPGVRSLLATPVLSSGRTAWGALIAGNCHDTAFNKRQLSLLQTIAGQVALVIQNADTLAELEYKTIVIERTRLAREIHDGLAQILGFLKLQSAKMRNYLAKGEIERARQSLEQYSNALTEAYQDVRQTIDGLRIEPAEVGLEAWLEQTVGEFRDLSGLQVVLNEADVQSDLPPEVHAQLIRIVQEALANVRKHAGASQVLVDCREVDDDLWLEIHDDGLGFAPEELDRPSQHGLRGMRERADLIGADFQVVSRPGEGTTVRVRLPLKGLRVEGITQ